MLRYQGLLDKMVDRILNGPGEADKNLRQAVANRAEGISLDSGMLADIPDDLKEWVEKVARHAYKTTDEDVDSLKTAGYSEDQIFELTVVAAYGAAKARLDAALAVVDVLEEVPHEA